MLLRFAAATHQRYSRLIQSECAGVATRISVCVRSQRRSLHESKPLQRPRRSESCVTRSLCAGRGRRCRAAPKSLRVGSAITSALAADLPLRSPAHQFHHRPGARGSGIQRLEFTTALAHAAERAAPKSLGVGSDTAERAWQRSPCASGSSQRFEHAADLRLRTPPHQFHYRFRRPLQASPARRVHHSTGDPLIRGSRSCTSNPPPRAAPAASERFRTTRPAAVQRLGSTTALAIR